MRLVATFYFSLTRHTVIKVFVSGCNYLDIGYRSCNFIDAVGDGCLKDI